MPVVREEYVVMHPLQQEVAVQVQEVYVWPMVLMEAQQGVLPVK